MGRKRKRANHDNYNRNERSIKNTREVSRKSKGKDRYAYEDEMYSRNSRKRSKDIVDYSTYKDNSPQYRSGKNTKNVDKRRRVKRRGRRKNFVSKMIGMILAILQFVLSVIFVVNVACFNMLPTTYLMVLAGVLLILLGITLLTQIGAKGKGIPGKIFSVILSIALAAGSLGIGSVNGAFEKMTGASTKTSTMYVSVLKDDPAEELADTKDYQYGVYYGADSSQVDATVKKIESELQSDLFTTEYTSIIELGQALLDGDVQAIIYKGSQEALIEDQIESFGEKTKEIYTYNIVLEIQNETVDVDMNQPFAVYLSGIDTAGEVSAEGRSDVNIIAVVNPTSHQVLLITTPRDYYVAIPGISNGQLDKLTHAGIYGVDASMATLSELYDVEIPFFGKVNFTSMIEIVDALGGLDVVSDATFVTSTNSGCVMQVNEGLNHFDGKEALAFCRERKNLPDGDNARGRHQQAVITAIIKKMMSPSMLRGAMDILESVSDGVDTNFSMEQIQSLIKTQLRTGAEWNIYSVSATGYGERNICFSSGSASLYVTVPDENSVAEITQLIDDVIAGKVIEESEKTTE